MIQHLSGCNENVELLEGVNWDQLVQEIFSMREGGQQSLQSVSIFCSQANLFTGTALHLLRRRKPSPSLIRKHQKTDRGTPGEEHLSAAVLLTSPSFIKRLWFCNSQNTTQRRWDEHWLMNAFITSVTLWCSLEGGKTVRREKRPCSCTPGVNLLHVTNFTVCWEKSAEALCSFFTSTYSVGSP